MSQPDDGYVPSTTRNLVAERRARLDLAASGKAHRIRGRKTGDPRLDRMRADVRRQTEQRRMGLA